MQTNFILKNNWIFLAIILSFVILLVNFFIAHAQVPTGGTFSICNTLDNLAVAMQALAGAVATVMVVYAAFKYLTAGDDAQKVKSAHATIAYAIIGLAVAAVAMGIPNIVFTALSIPVGTAACNF